MAELPKDMNPAVEFGFFVGVVPDMAGRVIGR